MKDRYVLVILALWIALKVAIFLFYLGMPANSPDASSPEVPARIHNW